MPGATDKPELALDKAKALDEVLLMLSGALERLDAIQLQRIALHVSMAIDLTKLERQSLYSDASPTAA